RGTRLRAPLVESAAVLLEHRLRVGVHEHSGGDEPVGVQAARGGMLADHAVHPGLRGRRLVGLVVAVTPVAHQVDHHVLAKADAASPCTSSASTRAARSSPRRSWRARTEPSTTASTTSRCEGLNASAVCTLPCAVRRSAEKPLWYFTSPEPLSRPGS